MHGRIKSMIIAGASAVALGAAACGGGAATLQSTAATGTPIKVMTITPINVAVGAGLPFPEIGVAAQAAADAINKAGGIKGHPIQLTVCDNKFSQNQDAACARQAVAEGDLALIGGISLQTNHISILEQAGIPVIGEYSAGELSFNSPIVFPFNAGNFNFYGCAAELADVAKAKRVATLSVYTAFNEVPSFRSNLAALLTKHGSQLVSFNLYTSGPDLTASVANALKDNPDAIYVGGGTADVDRVTQLVRQLNAKVAIARTSIADSSLQTLGPVAENVYVCDSYKPASLTKDPNVKKYVDEMKKTNSQVPVNTFAANTWAAMNVFAQVASGLDNVTSSGLLAALAKSKVDTLLGPTVDFTKTVHPELGYKHIYNFTWLYNQVRKGVIVNINNVRFVDPLA
jgi:ABC-type branched-subunit amino acid transport system substrate-binding protein